MDTAGRHRGIRELAQALQEPLRDVGTWMLETLPDGPDLANGLLKLLDMQRLYNFIPRPEEPPVAFPRGVNNVPHVQVEVLEPLSRGKPQRGKPSPMYIHLDERCPSVKSAFRRDGDVSRSEGFLDDVLSREPERPLCGWCARSLCAGRGEADWRWYHDHRERLRHVLDPAE